MDRTAFIRQNLELLFRSWLARATLWGCLLFLVLGALDYFVTPENFRLFLAYRLAISFLLLGGFYFSRSLHRRYLHVMGMILTFVSAAMIELMILRFGGGDSPYFVGMLLLSIAVIGMLPASFWFHAALAAGILLIYAVPILLTGTGGAGSTYLIGAVFLLLILSTMLLMRYIHWKQLIEDLGVRYELEQSRGHLEDAVAKRTTELAGAIEKLKQEMEERQRLQGELLQAQKMESIGRLAGGVAHDFNNILTATMSYAELGLMKLSPADPVYGHLVSIRDASEKAAALTRQLLAFSRKQLLEIRVRELNAIVSNMASLLSRMIGEDVILGIHLGAPVSSIRVDEGQVEQIVMNLAVNARDSMPNGGRLDIETDLVAASGIGIPGADASAADTWVRLSVADTGAGMTREVRERIFEPFFTTKEVGRGTGLGLATVYGIVRQHGGYIAVDSAPGRGTTFRTYFPLVVPSLPSPEHDDSAELPAGTETILVVDDDGAVRTAVRKALEPLGYRILETASGQEALSVAASFPGPIHLIITDLVMPGMNGKQLAEAFRTSHPGIHLVFMTGYAHDHLSSQGLLEQGAAVISKPVGPAELARNVRQVLDSRA